MEAFTSDLGFVRREITGAPIAGKTGVIAAVTTTRTIASNAMTVITMIASTPGGGGVDRDRIVTRQ